MILPKDKSQIRIRPAVLNDAQALLSIYAPYVTNTAISFEWEVPSLEEFQNRIASRMERYPWLVAEQNNSLLGYACTGPFIPRTAYNWEAETTIYLSRDAQGKGIGRMLYEKLEQISKLQNIVSLEACIGWPEIEDEYLTMNSVHFHEHMGYSLIGKFDRCGFKFGYWYSMVWMEKQIGEHLQAPPMVIPFPELMETGVLSFEN